LLGDHAKTHCYGCDFRWWKHHQQQVQTQYNGQCWTQDVQWEESGRKVDPSIWNIKQLVSVDKPGFSTDPNILHRGLNSGFQACNLAFHLLGKKQNGAQCRGRIILLGFDMMVHGGKRHWFGAHPQGMEMHSNYQNFAQQFGTIDQDQVEIWNCSRRTALTHFPIVSLDDACAALS